MYLLKEFKQRVSNEMSNCRFCLTTQYITVDLAKDCFEVAQAMLNNFRAIKEEGGFKMDDPSLVAKTETDLMFWADSARSIYDGILITDTLFKEWGINN